MKNPSVDDLREILVKSGKYTQEQADLIKGKSKLTEAVLALEANEDTDLNNIFNDIEVESSIPSPNLNLDKGSPDIPNKLSPEWQTYVMQQFRPEELDDNYPKLPGLRRVASILIGEIVSSMPVKLDTLVDERNPAGRSSCIYEIIFDTTHGNKVKFGAAASSWNGNTDDEFSVFTEAIAESRAEARALRKALNLNTVSKDEVTSKNIKEIVQTLNDRERSGDWTEDAEISAPQEMMIKKHCERVGIDLVKLLTKENLGSELSELTKKDASRIIELLNKYQSSSKDSLEIPVEIKKG